MNVRLALQVGEQMVLISWPLSQGPKGVDPRLVENLHGVALRELAEMGVMLAVVTVPR